MDIYNCLITFADYDHAGLRDFRKMEGYTMHKDGFVLSIEADNFLGTEDFCFVKANVKPRTRDVDPVTKLKHYKAWIVMTRDLSKCHIKSSYCTCKGG